MPLWVFLLVTFAPILVAIGVRYNSSSSIPTGIVNLFPLAGTWLLMHLLSMEAANGISLRKSATGSNEYDFYSCKTNSTPSIDRCMAVQFKPPGNLKFIPSSNPIKHCILEFIGSTCPSESIAFGLSGGITFNGTYWNLGNTKDVISGLVTSGPTTYIINNHTGFGSGFSSKNRLVIK